MPIAMAPVFALAAISLVETFGTQTIGEWSSKLTFLCGLIVAPVGVAITKFRDLCNIDGLTDLQRAKLIPIVRRRTFRFWVATLYLVSVFLAGFAVTATANTNIGYLVATAWITAFLFSLYILAISHFWIDEAEDFKIKVAQQLRDERERTDLIQALRKTQGDKVDPPTEMAQYNKVFDPKSGLVQ